MINEDGDLINYSDGEDPNVIYDIQWDNVKTLEDLKTLFKPAMVTMRGALALSDAIKKKLIK